jgi:hypothetical protein
LTTLSLTACAGFTSNSNTTIEPLPVKTALKNSSIVIAIPLAVEKKPTGGFRSLLDLQNEILLTEPVGINVPLAPNGFKLGIRARW